MKRIFTLLFAVLTATTIMAQMHGPMKFVGASNMTVSTMSNDNPSDTILFAMNGMESGNITLPAMKGMKTIPSVLNSRWARTMSLRLPTRLSAQR